MAQIDIEVMVDVEELMKDSSASSIIEHIKMLDDQTDNAYLNHNKSNLVSRVYPGDTLRWSIVPVKQGMEITLLKIIINDDSKWFIEEQDNILSVDPTTQTITGTISNSVIPGEICSYSIFYIIKDLGPISHDPLIEVRIH
jgi:hypothetical protein